MRLVHQFIAVYIPTHLFLSQILTDDLWFIIYCGQHFRQLEWLCQLSNSLMLIEDSKNATPADVNTFCEAMSSAALLGHLGTL